MRTQGPGALPRRALITLFLLWAALPEAALAQEAAAAAPAESPAKPLVEAFQKGPVAITAKVVRDAGKPGESVLPLFQVPVLNYRDRLELAFAGEAFDQRVTSAEWSLVVVFLPRTIAPTDQGVVDYRLKRKGDQMVVPAITVPYDSIPMIFLIPDKNARVKALQDLNDHLQAFRTLCAKISDLSSERATADKFLQDLDAIDKSLSPPQYDNALQGFLHAYGDALSGDLQTFLAGPTSNLEKCQFLAQEFRNTNVLVPGAAPAAPAAAAAAPAVATGAPPICAYVSILFDVAAIINNLWPGHQFQYLPALARNLNGFGADLYYTDWIHTTGDTRGALMCCPGKWEEQDPPAFDFELPAGESLLANQTLLKVHPKVKDRRPFALYGHDWKLLLTGPNGESLAPVNLVPSPNREAFVAAPGSIHAALRRLGAAQVKARIVGRWGFNNIAMDPVDLPAGCDPAWQPEPTESAAFQVGKACTFRFPAAWSGSVGQVLFRPSTKGAAPLTAQLKVLKDGAKEAVFDPRPEDAGPGSLEILPIGADTPAVARPLTLAGVPVEPAGVEARLGESVVSLRGRHLEDVQALEIGGRRFTAAAKGGSEAAVRFFAAEDGKPVSGTPGKALQAVLVTAKGRLPNSCPVTLLAQRPRLGEVRVTPEPAKEPGLPIVSSVPILSTSDSCQVSLITADDYRFPAGLAFRAAIRNADDPAEARTLPSSKMRVIGRNRKATFTFNPNDLLGDRAAGRLELQVQDDHAGASDWCPLPVTFLDLPVISAVQATAAGIRLVGPSLDQVEAVAAAPTGPWEKINVILAGGREAADLSTRLTGDTCYLRLIGWGDLVLAMKLPPVPSRVPAPNPASAAPAAPAEATKGKAAVLAPEPVAGAKESPAPEPVRAAASKAPPSTPAPEPAAPKAGPAAPSGPGPGPSAGAPAGPGAETKPDAAAGAGKGAPS